MRNYGLCQAVQRGHFDLVKYFVERYDEVSKFALRLAKEMHRDEILEYLKPIIFF